ncbi:MAG: alpha-amylase, partial [Propionibacteriaceae bacterium]|nr:alpha-amylase [Propionibacteriaceae bacterium]
SLQEVGQIPAAERQDPSFFRTEGAEIGRDGCRVPLPWTADGASFGFGANGAHLPQPEWFGAYAVETEAADPSSTLSLYRRALALRHELECAESLEWFEVSESVLGVERPNGWRAVMNFGADPVALPAGDVLLSSAPLTDGELPGETTVWLR